MRMRAHDMRQAREHTASVTVAVVLTMIVAVPMIVTVLVVLAVAVTGVVLVLVAVIMTVVVVRVARAVHDIQDARIIALQHIDN